MYWHFLASQSTCYENCSILLIIIIAEFCCMKNLRNFVACIAKSVTPLQWRHTGHDSVSNHQPRECLLSRLIRRRSNNTSKLRVTGLCTGNSPEAGEFPAQRASNAENTSIWWRHHAEGLQWTRCVAPSEMTCPSNPRTLFVTPYACAVCVRRACSRAGVHVRVCVCVTYANRM